MSEIQDRLADSINAEPIVFMDCTQRELMGAALCGCAIGMTLGLIAVMPFLGFIFGIASGLILTLLISWGLMIWLRTIRDKYYPTWFQEMIFLKKRSLGLGGTGPFIESGKIYRVGGRNGR